MQTGARSQDLDIFKKIILFAEDVLRKTALNMNGNAFKTTII